MSHCHGAKTGLPPGLQPRQGARTVVLAGNPNAGKSAVFNQLTGLYVDVSNYPGTTLELSHGALGNDLLVDTPGVYGISSFNDEERVARDVILAADVVINVVDAVHLERDLFLTQQIIDAGLAIVIALNMVDEAAKQGMGIDVKLLSDHLGVPVVPTVAVKRSGIDELKARMEEARNGNPTPGLREKLADLSRLTGNQGEALLVLEGDPAVSARHGLKPGTEREEIYRQRRDHVNNLIEKAVRIRSNRPSLGTRLGHLMVRPATGLPLLFLALWAMYELIGVVVAGHVVGFTEETVMRGLYEPAVRALVGALVPEESIPGTILVGEFGLLTMTVTYVIGLLLPLVASFYFSLSLFEDSGYLPRIATLVDRLLTGLGLNGRAVIPMILGFGCVTMATLVTRVLTSDRERRIAIFLLALSVPCSAQLAVIASMLSGLGPGYATLYALVIFSVFVAAGTALNALMPGKSSDLLIDLPPLRLPRLDNVLKKTLIKSHSFLREATPIFAAGALIIGLLQVTGILDLLQDLLAPLTVGWLALPRESATAFIMGIVRRDFGAAGLLDLPLTPLQTVVALITITLFVPCIASMLMIFKERSRPEAVVMWLATWVTAFSVGGIVNRMAGLSQQAGFAAGALPVATLFLIFALTTVGLAHGLRRLRELIGG